MIIFAALNTSIKTNIKQVADLLLPLFEILLVVNSTMLLFISTFANVFCASIYVFLH